MAEPCVLVWLRQDLRLADNRALVAAADTAAAVLPVYIDEDGYAGGGGASGEANACAPRPPGGASRWWLHHSLEALAADLAARGLPLLLRRGPALSALQALVQETGAVRVLWNRRSEPPAQAGERRIEHALQAAGIGVSTHAENLLFPPGRIVSGAGAPYALFTPFWRTCQAAAPPAVPLAVPDTLRPPAVVPASAPLESWRLRPTTPDWAGGLRTEWRCGERAAAARLQAFLAAGLRGYASQRDRPEPTATSMLSPHLHFGEISARQVWHATSLAIELDPSLRADGEAFLRELGWREFCAGLLRAHPDLARRPLQARFARLPWRTDPEALRAWQHGRTGYPLIDAGLRQLRRTGWMHNRVRMVVASFLVKDLLISWQDGEAWFWDTLVDADPANNAGGWQWVAGCGSDAAPYVRIFNPVAQGERFDPEGAYVRRWLPALAKLPARWVHRPWQAPPLELAAAGVRLGHDYPAPIIDHDQARRRALAAFAACKEQP